MQRESRIDSSNTKQKREREKRIKTSKLGRLISYFLKAKIPYKNYVWRLIWKKKNNNNNIKQAKKLIEYRYSKS